MLRKFFKTRASSVDEATDAPAPRTLRPALASWKRKSERQQDRVLTRSAQAWARGLPAGIHPKYLLDRYPRIVNRIAQCWGDAPRCDAVFEDLLSDRRGGRKGFPQRVASELMLLRHFHESTHSLQESAPL